MRKYTLNGPGPLKRSTVAGAAKDRRFEFTNDILHWLWSWRVQVDRHAESTRHDGEGETHLDKRRGYSKTSYDEHLLAVVGAHLLRAIRRAESELGESLFDSESAKALPLLRNLYEHWDEQRSAFADPAAPKVRSARTFSEDFPDGQPWSVSYVGKDMLLAGVVPIYALTEDLESLEARILALEDRFRRELPSAGPS